MGRNAKHIIKNFAAFVSYYTGLTGLLSKINNQSGARLTILGFHRVVDDAKRNDFYVNPHGCITKGDFEKLVVFIRERYRILSLAEAVGFRLRDAEFPENSLVLTFDDGYEDNYTNAYPILKKYNLPATIFITTDRVGSEEFFWWDELYFKLMKAKADGQEIRVNGTIPMGIKAKITRLNDRAARPHEAVVEIIDALKELPPYEVDLITRELSKVLPTDMSNYHSYFRMLKWEQVKEISAQGIAFGSHTRTHPILTKIEKSTLEQEIAGSQRVIENKLGYKPQFFAYPSGALNAAVRKVVMKSGYQCALGFSGGINTRAADLLNLKRKGMSSYLCMGYNGKFSKTILAAELVGIFEILRHIKSRLLGRN